MGHNVKFPSKTYKRNKRGKMARAYWRAKKEKCEDVSKNSAADASPPSTSCGKQGVSFEPLNSSNDVSKGISDTRDDGYNDLEYLSDESVGDLPNLMVEKDDSHIPVTKQLCGNRCVDISHVMKQMELLNSHKNECTMGKFNFRSETRSGFFCTWQFVCVSCDKVQHITSHNKDQAEDINDAAVWGAVSVGIGYSQLEEIFSVMNTPVMSNEKFRKHETAIEQAWEKYLTVKVNAAGIQEKKIAEENGHYLDGTPYITVVGDGGWGKRTYGHGYNSSTGVAVIIGQETGKILFLGIKNKYCSICSVAKSKKSSIPEHVCYKNHSGSSTAMEKDLICEGFNQSIAMHGIIYKNYIGDGDAAVLASIQQRCDYGRYVTKVECANHATRAFSEKIHKLVSNKSYELEGRKILTKVEGSDKISRIERLVKGVRTAIKEAAKITGKEAVDILRKDLQNAPNHVFGAHERCRQSFCKRKDSGEENLLPKLAASGLLQPIRDIIATLERKADKLITNSTTNAAERYMALNAKFTGAKRINFGKRWSYSTRCYGAALAHTSGPGWHPSPWKYMHGRSPGSTCKKLCQKRQEKTSKRRLKYQEDGAPKKRRKVGGGPDASYGDHDSLQQPDISVEEMESRCKTHLSKLREECNTTSKRESIEAATMGQHVSEKWHEVRINRLTASNFGVVVRRHDYTPCHNLVRNLLYPKDLNTPAILYGRVHESQALARYSSTKSEDVRPCGIFISADFPYLAASPDGLVSDDGLVEIKCLPSVKDRLLLDASQDKKSSLCLEVKHGSLQLKRNHRYYYQTQGQLNITGRNYCDFVVQTEKDFYVERIYKDENLWTNIMLPKLKKFYLQCMLPEIVDSRIKRNMKIRDPQYILSAQGELQKKKKKTKQ